MPFWLAIIIIIATIGGLSIAAFSMWIKFLEDQRQAGEATGELGKVITAQQEALEAAERRIQNLEAIVISHEWDAVQGEAAGLAGTAGSTAGTAGSVAGTAAGRVDPDLLDDEASDADRAAEIARRLRT
ncbi:MAG: hypothetical protein HKN29_12450 [Rhodothermales bacterium]|nr:hypothetical protein [Rhodothermales bacterium]